MKCVSVLLAIVTLASAGATLLGVSPQAHAGNAFLDLFDTGETVGTLPSNWVVQSQLGNTQGTVITDGTAPSQPNSFEVANPDNEGLEFNRLFAAVTLADVASVSFKFSVYVDELPNGTVTENRGFNLRIGSGASGANGFSANLAGIRFLNGTGSQYGLFNTFTPASLSGPVYDEDTWYDIELVITPTSATEGTYQWKVNGADIGGAFAYSGISTVNRVGVSINSGNSDATNKNTTYRLDNVSVSTSPVPEAGSFALSMMGGLLILTRRQRSRQAG